MQILDLYQIISASLNGLTFSINRFIFGFIGVIIGLVRFDKTLMPAWINTFLQLDSIVSSFDSFIITFHNFNNPIMENMFKFLNKSN